MSASVNSAVVNPLPSFVTEPGGSDVLMIAVAVFLIASVAIVGVLFFRLHTLPERLAHKSKKVQLEIVAVLGLISLFTHMHIFWIIGLLLALIEIPNFGGVLNRIAAGVEDLARRNSENAASIRTGGEARLIVGEPKPKEWATEKTQPPVSARESAGHV